MNRNWSSKFGHIGEIGQTVVEIGQTDSHIGYVSERIGQALTEIGQANTATLVKRVAYWSNRFGQIKHIGQTDSHIGQMNFVQSGKLVKRVRELVKRAGEIGQACRGNWSSV